MNGNDARKTRDARLQDYLDARLSEEDRVAFEVRLEADPDLARDVEAAFALRRDLGEPASGDALSPGFYTRARKRFSDSRDRKPGRRMFAVLSWETAGLAATVVLAAAVFLPGIVRQDPDAPLAPTRREEVFSPLPDTTLNDEAAGDVAAGPGPTPGKESAGRQKKKAAPEPRDLPARDDRDAFAPQPSSAGIPPSEVPEAIGLALEGDKGSPGAVRTEEAKESEMKREQELPPRPAIAAPEGFVRAEESLELDSTRKNLRDRSAMAHEPSRGRAAKIGQATMEDAKDRAELNGVEIPSGLVPAGAVESVVEIEEIESLLRGPAGARLGPSVRAEPTPRIVLVGPRGVPVSCRGIVHLFDGRRHVLRLPGVDSGASPATGGCAVVLPRDGRPVVVEDPEDER